MTEVWLLYTYIKHALELGLYHWATQLTLLIFYLGIYQPESGWLNHSASEFTVLAPYHSPFFVLVRGLLCLMTQRAMAVGTSASGRDT